MKPTEFTRVLCPSALAAAILSTILDLEGYAAVWFVAADGHVVATAAPSAFLTSAIDTTTTMLNHKRGGVA